MPRISGNDGHRMRMRKKLAENGAGAFEPHELLEMFLHTAIVRRDTKTIAKELINKFGCVKNTLCADKETLASINGIGSSTAALFSLCGEVCNYIENFEYPSYSGGFIQFAADVVSGDSGLEFYYAVTDGCGHILYLRRIFCGSILLLDDYMCEIAESVVATGGAEVYLFQCRKGENFLHIYNEDVIQIGKVSRYLKRMEIRLADFIILNGKKYISFEMFGKLPK